MKSIPPRRINRPRPTRPPVLKPGPVADPTREKCESNLTILVTASEWEWFEKVRLSMPIPPTRSAMGRYLLTESLERRKRRDLPGKAVDYSRV